MKKYRNKGSFTIEASIWCPLLLSIAAYVLQGGIGLYREIKTGSFLQEEINELDIVQEFYNYQILDEVMQEVTGD